MLSLELNKRALTMGVVRRRLPAFRGGPSGYPPRCFPPRLVLQTAPTPSAILAPTVACLVGPTASAIPVPTASTVQTTGAKLHPGSTTIRADREDPRGLEGQRGESRGCRRPPGGAAGVLRPDVRRRIRRQTGTQDSRRHSRSQRAMRCSCSQATRRRRDNTRHPSRSGWEPST